ncbi:MAG: hypothetical protein C6Y20_17855 [Tagaea sp. CACIAM 22H2]|nr:hypothetical protein [Tagaea sp. CACIAM 22H2]
MVLSLDWQILMGEARKRAIAHDLEDDRRGFFHAVMAPIFGLTAAEIEDAITDQRRDRGIDAFFFDERHGALELHLMNFKFTDKLANAESFFPGTEIDKVISFLREFLGQRPQLLNSCNDLLVPKIKYVWQRFQSPFFRVSLHFCSNQTRFMLDDRRRLDAAVAEFSFVSVYEHDTTSLVERYVRARSPDATGTLQLLETQYFERTDGNVRGVVATIQAHDLVHLIRDARNSKEIRRDLFNENIRLYLGSKNAVNKSIIETASGDGAADFWYLNNGITIVCDKYAFNKGVSSPAIRLTNPQIVNGGQTANALFEVSAVAEERLKKVSVLVRIYEATRADLKTVVAASTNNQTRIDSRDLKSNDQIQKRIEISLEQSGYFYERKVDQHIEKPAAKRIDALRAGQAYLSYYGYLPDKARTQSDKIFDEWYDRVFDKSFSAERLLTAYKCLQLVDERKKLVKKRLRDGYGASEPDEFLVEGNFHVLYVMGQICLRDRQEITDFEVAKTKLDEAINVTRTVASKYRHKSFYRFFRSVDARELLFSEIFNIPDGGQLSFLSD